MHKNITLQDIKRHGAKALPTSGTSYIIVNSKPKSAVLPVDEYEMLIEALEELEDIRAIETRHHEDTVSEAEIF